MKSYDNYQEASRASWTTAADAPNLEQLRFGALQRIAAALEKIAETQAKILAEASEAQRLRRQVRALRAAVTRLQNAAAKR